MAALQLAFEQATANLVWPVCRAQFSTQIGSLYVARFWHLTEVSRPANIMNLFNQHTAQKQNY
jgi:hypothetical protein